eukprot:1344194-Rhodomonas_salina.2
MVLCDVQYSVGYAATRRFVLTRVCMVVPGRPNRRSGCVCGRGDDAACTGERLRCPRACRYVVHREIKCETHRRSTICTGKAVDFAAHPPLLRELLRCYPLLLCYPLLFCYPLLSTLLLSTLLLSSAASLLHRQAQTLASRGLCGIRRRSRVATRTGSSLRKEGCTRLDSQV